jgi:hypothetical protein
MYYIQKARTTENIPKYSKEVFEEQMLTTVLLANLPFQVVEHHSFRKLLSIARPGIDVVNRSRLR